MKLLVSFLAIISLSFHGNVKALDINEKAVPMPDLPLVSEYVWWIAKVTKYEEPEGVNLTDEDKKFCSPWTFFEHCGPMRLKYDVVNETAILKLWALNKNDNKIYYTQSKIEKIDHNKAIFQLKVDKTGKVMCENGKSLTLQIPQTIKELQEKRQAVVYMEPKGMYQIAGDERNAWILVRDYVVRQNQVEQLYNTDIVNRLKNLGIPEDKIVTPGHKFDTDVDFLALEGVNCKVKAMSMPGLAEIIINLFQIPINMWLVRATQYTPNMVNDVGALTAEDMQICSPNALFENCGPIRYSNYGFTNSTMWSTRKGQDGKFEILKMDGKNEKIDKNLAIFRSKVNRNATVISENGESRPVTLSEGAIELIEKPYAVIKVAHKKYLIVSDCEGNNVWATVSNELVDKNEVDHYIPTIEEELKKLKNPKPLVNLKTEFPINVDLANL